ncbi:MAG TPA: carboxymuconolactone decarboxylase family protein [Rhodocyclaceae bacterium]
MSQRFDVHQLSPDGYRAMLELSGYVKKSGLELDLLELTKIRASQINGCAFCVAMHVEEARKLGVAEVRMHMLSVWREAVCYSDRERAALAWTEALTRLSDGEISDAVYAEVCQQFTAKEISDLTYAAALINGWNRLMIASRTPLQVGVAK